MLGAIIYCKCETELGVPRRTVCRAQEAEKGVGMKVFHTISHAMPICYRYSREERYPPCGPVEKSRTRIEVMIWPGQARPGHGRHGMHLQTQEAAQRFMRSRLRSKFLAPEATKYIKALALTKLLHARAEHTLHGPAQSTLTTDHRPDTSRSFGFLRDCLHHSG
ncbi:uncharacterized protein MYCFIDRAFT_169429 [Pseudocercospora fijiensis CIRAD86]|uniref:Uncharacterized protein n=1 Tax=Pseudocercospora fijiensis (strain CIRAD86) TaxID=383855 RepID=N1Q9T4_PSEFD|nr:uncharacterized protein MYCFIDRAFT_169429 [Pseudocercospora fijiensis CIRAD86]EME87642.1 hypothetical protein MYCFIDRAFT_169429 [Pseudocercospora fijiensis CIRAD86]